MNGFFNAAAVPSVTYTMLTIKAGMPAARFDPPNACCAECPAMQCAV
jgi:hypothetical protein